MFNYHPSLIKHVVIQTPKALLGVILVSVIFCWTIYDFIPLELLAIWSFFQIIFIYLRFKNAQNLQYYLEKKDPEKLKEHVLYFSLYLVYSALVWNASVFLSILYGPPNYEFAIMLMIVGVVTAGSLSLASIFNSFALFFLLMIAPQFFIMMSYYEDTAHLTVGVFLFIAIPLFFLLSKSIYRGQLENIEIHTELENNVLKLHELSIRDALTNAYNRRHFLDTSKNLISLARRKPTEISLLMIDIDFFKNINDTHGHQFGDFVLVELVKEIQAMTRDSDILARVGGEEFALLLHHTSLSGAVLIAEKLRKAVEHHVFIFNNIELQITVSIGVSTLSDPDDTIDILYNRADEKLYKAKKNGRNQVC